MPLLLPLVSVVSVWAGWNAYGKYNQVAGEAAGIGPLVKTAAVVGVLAGAAGFYLARR